MCWVAEVDVDVAVNFDDDDSTTGGALTSSCGGGTEVVLGPEEGVPLWTADGDIIPAL